MSDKTISSSHSCSGNRSGTQELSEVLRDEQCTSPQQHREWMMRVLDAALDIATNTNLFANNEEDIAMTNMSATASAGHQSQ
jgi:hypothetical protein